MRPEDLLCATCGGRVAEARCPSCRASLQYLRRQRHDLPAGPVLLLALLVLLLVLILL